MTTTPTPKVKTYLALDVGEKRIGVARGNSLARLPQPLTTVKGENALQSVLELAEAYEAAGLVVGLPRGLKGQETAQTGVICQFIASLKSATNIPVYTQDEALTSVKAEGEMQDRKVRYNKEDVDALAATYILEDYFREHPEG